MPFTLVKTQDGFIHGNLSWGAFVPNCDYCEQVVGLMVDGSVPEFGLVPGKKFKCPVCRAYGVLPNPISDSDMDVN